MLSSDPVISAHSPDKESARMNKIATQQGNCEQGMSILELLVVFLIISIMMNSAVSNLAEIKDPLKDGVSQCLGFVKQVRAKALSTTSAYFLSAGSDGQLVSSWGSTCESSTPTPDPTLFLDLPNGVTLTDTAWSVCFDSRGLASGEQTFSVQDVDGRNETIEIFLGGAVRIRP